MPKKKIIIIGPAHPLRGGLATFDHRLCKAFVEAGHLCEIFSYALQYPSFLFPGSTQYTQESAPEDIKITTCINSVNPINWIKVGRQLKDLCPDIIVVRYWLPFMGPCLGTILQQVKKNKHTRIIAITDNVKPHEPRFYDAAATRYFLKRVDACVTMSEKVMQDLRSFEPHKKAIQLQHPLYDSFGEILPKQVARKKIGLPENEKLILFFGFIRKYKGLDLLLQAMTNTYIQAEEIKLVVAGEFYEDKQFYLDYITQNNLTSSVYLRTEFIQDSEVANYLCATDFVIQPYKNATQSGVTPLAYYFEKPMLVTNVGGLPALVKEQKSGVVVEPNSDSIAQGIKTLYEMNQTELVEHVCIEKAKLSWPVFVEQIIEL